MKLEHIDKAQYRKMTNRVQMGLVAILAISSVVFGQLLITFLGGEPAAPGQPTGNFYYNLGGVILGLMLCTLVVKHYREKPAFYEVYYIWQLKQFQNQIFRKLNNIQQGVDNNEMHAITILLFYYRSLALVYELDNNTLTLSDVNNHINKLSEKAAALELDANVNELSPEALKSY